MGKSQKTTTAHRQIRISNQALQNINEAIGYIAFVAHAPKTAVKVGDVVFATIDRIAKNPLAFKECEELPTKARMYRRALCYSWVLIYRVTESEIIILGLIHAARRPSAIRKLRRIK